VLRWYKMVSKSLPMERSRSVSVTVGGVMLKSLAKSLLGGVSVAALSCSAFAADMAVKAPPPPLAAPYSWTGAYFGLNAGGDWPDDPNATVTYQRFTGGPPGVGTPHALQAASLNSGSSAFGGAQLGYNWQLQQRWVVGLETDIDISNATSGNAFLAEGPITDTVGSSRGLDWFGTVRGRIGYLIDPRILTYVTGGLAYGRTQNNFTQAITGPGPVGVFALTNTAPSTSTGWTVGGGIEYALDAKWSAKIEYDYLAFNDGVSSMNTIFFNPGAKGNVGVFNVLAPNNSTQTVRFGLNYHFWSS
jgi:outer membrane immunogenic protein